MAVIKKEISAGILFFTEEQELFMGRVTGSGSNGLPHRWDIPKGHIEEGETALEAAVRECREETGFIDFNPASLIDLGQHKYASNKDLHLFVYPFPMRHEQFVYCECTAYHTDPETGKSFQEIDAFDFMKPEQWNYVMGPSLFNVMQKLFPDLAKRTF